MGRVDSRAKPIRRKANVRRIKDVKKVCISDCKLVEVFVVCKGARQNGEEIM